MTKIYGGPNQRNLVSGFLQTMFVDLIREQEDEKGPAKWNIRCSEGFILGGPVVKLKTDKHVWEFERLTQKSPGPWLYHYVQAMDPAGERAVIFFVPP